MAERAPHQIHATLMESDARFGDLMRHVLTEDHPQWVIDSLSSVKDAEEYIERIRKEAKERPSSERPDFHLLVADHVPFAAFPVFGKIKGELGSIAPSILLLTADNSPDLDRDALSSGVDVVVHKPFEIGDFQTAIERIIQLREESMLQ